MFSRWTGLALSGGGALTILINAILTPLLPRHAIFAVTAASSLFLWRQSLSAVAAALLLFGCVGLYLLEHERAGRFGAFAFAVAFLGTALLLGTEWNEVFLVRDLAQRAPAALQKLDGAPHPSLYDLGAIIPLSIFTIGWIAMAASMIRNRSLPRTASVLVIAGFFAIPILSAVIHNSSGAIAGNAILGAGWFWLGHELRTRGAGSIPMISSA
jgi:hypothetical protein